MKFSGPGHDDLVSRRSVVRDHVRTQHHIVAVTRHLVRRARTLKLHFRARDSGVAPRKLAEKLRIDEQFFFLTDRSRNPAPKLLDSDRRRGSAQLDRAVERL